MKSCATHASKCAVQPTSTELLQSICRADRLAILASLAVATGIWGDVVVLPVAGFIFGSLVTRRTIPREDNSCEQKGMPLVLASDAYVKLLRSRGDRDADWVARKIRIGVEWRSELVVGGHSPSSRLEAIFGCRVDDPLLSRESLELAGHVLASGCLYWHGVDAAGRPILWARSGLIDWDRAKATDFVRAVATTLELGAVAANRLATPPQIVYVECTSGVNVASFPVRTAYRILRGCLDAFTRGFPERGAAFLVAPTTRINRILFALTKPFAPSSIISRVELLAPHDTHCRLVELLGDPKLVPDFFGGPAHHELPRRGGEELDVLESFARLLKPSR